MKLIYLCFYNYMEVFYKIINLSATCIIDNPVLKQNCCFQVIIPKYYLYKFQIDSYSI